MIRISTRAVALCSLTLTACVVTPYPYVGSGVESGPSVIATVPPPAPHVEVVPVMPFPGAVWIGGYWAWSGRSHAWVPGRWERHRPGYAWTAPRWEQRGRHWHQHPGGWHRR